LLSGVFAALWLLGLYAAAPALRKHGPYDFVDRLRDALVLGVAIPLGLGLVHALYPIACWLALAACLVIAWRRDLRDGERHARQRRTARRPYLLIAALALVAWPPLMRPLLDGDSLSYHLPNAASWVQAHSLWTATTRYWWYPPASELFASGLYAVSGPFALPWCGFGALALVGFRVLAWSRHAFAAPPLLADALAAATVTAYPLAIQAGTLQNDVWLAAFWLESLWSIGRDEGAAMRAIAVTALIKPQGWLFAAVALAVTKAKARIWLAAAGAIALWLLHDAVLWRSAVLTLASTAYGSTFASSILAHGLAALGLLVRVGLRTSPFALIALGVALLGLPIGRREPRLAWAGFIAALIFLALPFGYASNVAQLATGASLRFAAPAIVVGALLLTRAANRIPLVATALLGASALFGAASILGVFYNDAPTLVAPAVALLAIGAIALARAARTPWPIPAGMAIVAIVASLLAASHPVDFYTDALRVNGRTTGLYDWISKRRPAAIGGLGIALGAVNVLSPRTRSLELIDRGACPLAAQRRLLLVAIAEDGRPSPFNARRLRAARACGAVLYDDGLAVVSAP
jgi:hypothetical protein